jgi:hypothetical protein
VRYAAAFDEGVSCLWRLNESCGADRENALAYVPQALTRQVIVSTDNCPSSRFPSQVVRLTRPRAQPLSMTPVMRNEITISIDNQSTTCRLGFREPLRFLCVRVNAGCRIASGSADLASRSARLCSASSELRELEDPIVLQAMPGNLSAYLSQVEEDGADYVVIDTPPHAGGTIDAAIRAANLVAFPFAQDPLTSMQVAGTVEIMEQTGRPGIFVLSQVHPWDPKATTPRRCCRTSILMCLWLRRGSASARRSCRR